MKPMYTISPRRKAQLAELLAMDTPIAKLAAELRRIAFALEGMERTLPQYEEFCTTATMLRIRIRQNGTRRSELRMVLQAAGYSTNDIAYMESADVAAPVALAG